MCAARALVTSSLPSLVHAVTWTGSTMDGDNAAAPAPDADPYAFPPSGSADAGAPSLLLPPARAAAEVVQQEKRRRLVQALHRAADLIDGADILLLHTGAG